MVDVEVEYNYEAEQSDELSIKVGDIIKNVTMSEGGWWEGEINGKRGMFPDNFVKVVPKKEEGKKKDVQASKRQSVKDLANKLKGQVHEGPPILRKKEPGTKKKRAKVVYSYDPENDDELKLEVGDMLDVIKQEEEGWWEGINNGKQGMFPSNFVEVVEEGSDTTSAESAADNKPENTEEHLIKGKKIQGIGLGNIFGDGPIKLRSTGNKKPADRPAEPPKAESRSESAQKKLKESKPVEKAVVRYSYTAENEDELTLNEGEIVIVLEKELEDSGWWKGELNGRVGVFPDNFVELIKEEPNKVQQSSVPAPQPKPKRPPSQPLKITPKLPDKAPSVESAKPDPPKAEDKPAHTKKPIHPPPPLTKKPIKPIDTVKEEKKDEPKPAEPSHSFEAVETPADKLTHLTATRPRGPAKRPPSQPKKSDEPIKEEERNGDVKDHHWIKEEKPADVHRHHVQHHSKPDKSDEVSGKQPSIPTRPPEPSPAVNAGLQVAIDEIRKEMQDMRRELHDSRANSVSKTAFNELKGENEQLKKDLDSLKTKYSRRMNELMTEIDEEKKLRLTTQVEMERIRKLVAESHV